MGGAAEQALRILRIGGASRFDRSLDRELASAGLSAKLASKPALLASGHLEVAQVVSIGAADAGVATRDAAIAYGLHFIPLQEERYDLVVPIAVADDARIQRFLDVMPPRGSDRGSFLLPLHAIIHVKLEGDHLELAPLAYDWFADQLRAGKQIAGLNATLDQKDNVLLVAPVDRLREWLRGQSVDGPAFGAAATFKRSR